MLLSVLRFKLYFKTEKIAGAEEFDYEFPGGVMLVVVLVC